MQIHQVGGISFLINPVYCAETDKDDALSIVQRVIRYLYAEKVTWCDFPSNLNTKLKYIVVNKSQEIMSLWNKLSPNYVNIRSLKSLKSKNFNQQITWMFT